MNGLNGRFGDQNRIRNPFLVSGRDSGNVLDVVCIDLGLRFEDLVGVFSELFSAHTSTLEMLISYFVFYNISWL